MAITWDVKVNEIGNSNSFSINATITDDTKSVGNQVETAAILSAKMDTPERKKQVWDGLKKQYNEKVGNTDITAALEVEGKDYLEKK